MAQKLQQQLMEVGSKLASPPASKDALIKHLKQAANCLSELDQSPSPRMLDSMKPCLDAIAKQELLKHQDKDVKVLVATCICEITRVTAPEAPYNDDILREIFHLIVGILGGLNDINSPSFGRRVVILEMLARYRSCVMMLDLECDDLIEEMFSTCFSVLSDDHPKTVLLSMQKIMILILDESEDIQENLLSTLLSPLGRKKSDFSVASRRLAMDVIRHCAGKLEPSVKQFLVSSLSGDVSSLNDSIDYHEVIYDIYQCAPQMLSGIVPYITAVLLADSLDVRLKAVHLLGELFALRGVSISESFQPLFSEFLKRLTDRAVEVRVSVIEHLKNCLISNPTHPEVPLIIKALSDRLLDYDENVRKQVVAAIYDVACDSVKVIPAETARLVAERLRDKSQSVKRYTMKRLADLYRFYCSKSSDGSLSADEYEWIPGKILRCLYDKDFRSESIELILCGFLFPPEFSIKDRLKHWATVISGFDKVEVKALEQILLQKQRLQQEMRKYLSLRQKYQEDASELQKRTSVCFRNMSRLFSDVAKVVEGFQVLNQLKDVNIWKMLTALLDSCTSFHQSWSYRDDLLKILGDKHPLYDFMSALSIKCSYLLFNKDYVKEILLEASAQKSNGHVKFISSCMNLLAIIACFSPQLLLGSEETLVDLLKEDNEIIKEGIAHVLAKAGGAIREQLAKTSSSVELLLERLCLEGSRKQAKYSVQAIAAITKDDGLKSLSVLYKRLVDNLDEKTHLPAILQSLGCIAQSAMPVFETREDEIVGFIQQKVLERSNMGGVSTHPTEWNERTELCLLKIFGIKTLVKSYLPVRDAHLRPEIDKVVGILKNVLSFGDFSKDIESSVVDKAHMRLAAAKAVLRLSRQWDHKIPVDIVYMTLRVSEDAYAQSRKLFLSKVHQYIKERLLDAKYACAFLLGINQHHSPEYNEGKHNLLEVVQICQQVKIRQLSLQTDGSSTTTYPEYLLAYLVHVLAHHPSCPNINESKDVKDFEPIYCRLHLFLSLLLHGDEGGPNKKKERLTCLVSILQSIKCSEDVVDRTKSNTSHAICDLGLSIMKRLVPEQTDFSGTATPISLPPTLYKSVENSEGERSVENGEQTLLDGETIVAHFEALMFEDKELILSGEAEDEMVIEEEDGDGNEVPLGKMMKMLKAQGMKKKKNLKNRNVSSNTKTSENEVDVLGLVREINLDNMEEDRSTEIGNLTSDHDHFEGEPSPSQLIKGTNSTSMLSVPTPKRKRSAPSQRSHSNSAKEQKQSGGMSISQSIKTVGKTQGRKLFKGTNESTDSDLLVSCLPTIKSMLSWSDKKDAEGSKSGAISNPKKSPNLAGTAKEVGVTRSSSGSSKKRKVRRVSGLTKCSSHSTQLGDEELVGSRIKVWWPLDKVFYEGIVRSYDLEKKKHEILYDDGEVEFLRLDKEEWELITKSNMSKKRPKYHPPSLNTELSAEKTNKKKVHGFSKGDRDSPKKVKRRTVSKRKIDRNGRKASENDINVDESDIDGSGNSDLSDVPPHSGSEIHNANSDGSEGRHTTPQLEIEEQTETNAAEMAEEPLEEVKPDPSAVHCDGDSDDEPLNTWKIRAGNTV